jgi:hypothetical protein
LDSYQGCAEAEGFPRRDVPLVVVEEELREHDKIKIIVLCDDQAGSTNEARKNDT